MQVLAPLGLVTLLVCSHGAQVRQGARGHGGGSLHRQEETQRQHLLQHPCENMKHEGNADTTRVTSPKGAKTTIFYIVSGPGLVPKASPGLEVQFPVKNVGFGCVFAELRPLSSFLKSLEPFCLF